MKKIINDAQDLRTHLLAERDDKSITQNRTCIISANQETSSVIVFSISFFMKF